MDASLAQDGHGYASCRSNRVFSRARAVEEVWNGLYQIEFIHRVAALDTAEIGRTLARIRDTLVRAGVLVNVTGSEAGMAKRVRALGERFGCFGAPQAVSGKAEDFLTAFGLGGNSGQEVFVSSSLQVGFAALTLGAAPFASAEQVAETTLAHELSTGALWEEIRMKGGAYGAFAHIDALEQTFSLSTYRDPNPLGSLDAFSTILQDVASQPVDEDFLEKAIIGTYAKMTHPLSPSQQGFVDFRRFLSGISDQQRQQRLRFLLDLDGSAVALAAQRLAGWKGYPCPVILGGPALAEKAAPGAEIHRLDI
jgi:Zn-dependent M16 (insulinase) family peptidase